MIGAGLAGLCAAFWLRRSGHTVTVFDRHDTVAQETSFANGGMLTPSMSEPWNAPGIHRELWHSLFDPTAAFRLQWQLLPEYWHWGLRFLRNSRQASFEHAMRANVALSQFSVQLMPELREELALDYQATTQGSMKLFRDVRGLETAWRHCELLQDYGLAARRVAQDDIALEEPFLAEAAEKFFGAIRYPNDEVGNARQFCEHLYAHLVTQGVKFDFGRSVLALCENNRKVTGLTLEDCQGNSEINADTVIVANATDAPRLVADFGIDLSIQAVRGFSLTVNPPDTEHGSATMLPKMALIDDARHVSAAPLGQSIRLAGTAELAGMNRRLDERRLENLRSYLMELKPEISRAAFNDAQPWCGLRPMSSDGLPYIGGTKIAGLYINAGHGHLGWTQAVGSGRLLAAIVNDEALSENAVQVEDFAVGRH